MVLYSEGRNVCPVPLYKQRKQGQFVPPRWLLLLHLHEPPPRPLLLEAERAALRPPLPPASPMPSTSPTTSAMAPKADKGKGVKSAEAQRLAALRKERAIFTPQLGVQELREYFYLFWATETRAHPRTRVLPAAASESAPNGYPFFPLFFYCGLCPPFSEFFCDIMNTYGFRLLDFTPNAVLTMAVFAHLCENFVGVHPSVALFRHFFIPRVERGEPLAGGIAWISRVGKKEAYLEGELRSKWEEWRAEWCWIVEENPQPFTALRQAPIVRGNDWSNVAPEDERLKIAITRILRLRLAGLTVGAVGADFLRRRIAPLQERGRPAWEFKNSADIMRLRPGLNFNLPSWSWMRCSWSCSNEIPNIHSRCRGASFRCATIRRLTGSA